MSEVQSSRNPSAKPELIVIAGPTASGKTAAAVELCRCIGGEVISVDSMQIYRGMDILSAKPTPEEMAGVLHHKEGSMREVRSSQSQVERTTKRIQ